jgi:D-alanine-D-alanine ligase
MKVALVRNDADAQVINRLGRPSPERYSARAVQRVADALTSAGHEVSVLEADMHLLTRLAAELPPVAAPDGAPLEAMVFNMAYGIQGDCRYTHLPAMLEMAGLPYTGSGPMGHTLSLDKVVTKTLIAAAGVPTPAYRVARTAAELHGLRYPVVVKPRHESTSYGLRLAGDPKAAGEAVAKVVARYRQPALVEEYVDGREVCVALLGNGDQLRCLPAVEIDFGDRPFRLLTKADKFHGRDDEPERICPARLEPALLQHIEEVARATFAICACRDYARVDLRIAGDGTPYVLEINSMASLGIGGSFVLAAQVAGLDFPQLVNEIVGVAMARCIADAAQSVPSVAAAVPHAQV